MASQSNILNIPRINEFRDDEKALIENTMSRLMVWGVLEKLHVRLKAVKARPKTKESQDLANEISSMREDLTKTLFIYLDTDYNMQLYRSKYEQEKLENETLQLKLEELRKKYDELLNNAEI